MQGHRKLVAAAQTLGAGVVASLLGGEGGGHISTTHASGRKIAAVPRCSVAVSTAAAAPPPPPGGTPQSRARPAARRWPASPRALPPGSAAGPPLTAPSHRPPTALQQNQQGEQSAFFVPSVFITAGGTEAAAHSAMRTAAPPPLTHPPLNLVPSANLQTPRPWRLSPSHSPAGRPHTGADSEETSHGSRQ